MSPAPGPTPLPRPAASPRTRRYGAALAAAVLAGALLRWSVHRDFVASDPSFGEPLLDARMFMDWAGRIAGGDLLGRGPFFFNPLYPYLLAPVVAIAHADALAVLRLLQAGAGLATVLLVAGATRLFLGRRTAVVAAFLAAAWPSSLYLEELAIGAALGVLLNALGLWLLARWRARPTRGRLLAAGVALGFAVVNRPNALLFLAVLPAWFLLLSRRGCATADGGRASSRDGAGGLRRVAGTTGLLLFGAILPLLPVVLRNLAVVGEPILTTSSMGVNLHLSNNPLSWRNGRMDSAEIDFNPFLMEDASRAVAEARSGRSLSPSEVSAWWTRHALDDVAREPGPAATFLLRKTLYLCGSDELPSSDSFRQAREDFPTLRALYAVLAFGIAFPFAVLGALSILRRRRRALPLVLMALTYGASLVVFIPLAHYRAPILPAVLPLAAAGVVMLAGGGRRRAGFSTGGAVAVLVVSAAVSHGNGLARAAGADSLGPCPESPVWLLAVRAHALVDVALDAGSRHDSRERDRVLALAEAQARHALAVSPPGDPGKWVIYAALARVAKGRGLLEEESLRLDDALADSPGRPQVLVDRAINLLRRGMRAEAVAGARAAREAGAALPAELERLLEAGK